MAAYLPISRAAAATGAGWQARSQRLLIRAILIRSYGEVFLTNFQIKFTEGLNRFCGPPHLVWDWHR